MPVLSLDDHLEACCSLLAKEGWEAFSHYICSDSSTVREYFLSPEDVLGAFFKALHHHIESDLILIQEDLAELSLKEQLLEVFIKRFEVLQPYRPMMSCLYQESMRNPCLGVLLSKFMWDNSAKILELLNQKASWNLIVPILWAQGGAIKTWLEDTSLDLSLTLFELDQRLTRIAPFLT